MFSYQQISNYGPRKWFDIKGKKEIEEAHSADCMNVEIKDTIPCFNYKQNHWVVSDYPALFGAWSNLPTMEMRDQICECSSDIVPSSVLRGCGTRDSSQRCGSCPSHCWPLCSSGSGGECKVCSQHGHLSACFWSICLSIEKYNYYPYVLPCWEGEGDAALSE